MVTQRIAYGMATALEERFGLSSQAIRDIKNEIFFKSTTETFIQTRNLSGSDQAFEVGLHRTSHQPFELESWFWRHRPDGSFFDGKICILPVVEEVVAQSNSVNRPAETVELRPTSMDASTYVDLLAGEGGLMQHIRATMGWLPDVEVVIQHDGAGPPNRKGNFYLVLATNTSCRSA